MDLYLDILYLIVFFTMVVVSMKLLMSSNFEKLFKQGKINEIRVGYFVAAIIISFLSAKSVVTITEVIYNILTK
jgi:uncharacterized membrane protein YwzB